MTREIVHGVKLLTQLNYFKTGVPGLEVRVNGFIKRAVKELYSRLLREAQGTAGISPDDATSVHTAVNAMRDRERILVRPNLKPDKPDSLKWATGGIANKS